MTKATKPKAAGRAGSDIAGEIVSAVVLASHLDVGRTFIPKLEADGVIQRVQGGGYRLGEARTNYIRHLRRNRLQSPKSKAEEAFIAERTKALEIKNAQRLNELFPTEVAFAVIDDFVAACIIEIQSLAARIAPTDLHLRRRVDQVVFEARKTISGRIAEKARQAMPKVASDKSAKDETRTGED